MRALALACLLSLTAGPVWSQTDEPEVSTGPKTEVEKLAKSYDVEVQAFWVEFQKLEDDDARQKYYETKYPKPDATAAKMMVIAKANAGKPLGFDAIFWALNNRVQGESKSTALELLGAHYLEEPRLGHVLGSIERDPSTAAGGFLLAAMKSSKREVKGAAHFHYAKYLLNLGSLANYLEGAKGDERKQFVEYLGGDAAAKEIAAMDHAKLAVQAEGLLDTVAKKFADLDAGRGQTMGDVAKRDLFEVRNLSVGKPAPEIKGEDVHGKTFALTEYRGKVIFLDFWGDW